MKNVVFIGQVTDISGYGNAARSYLQSLLALHTEGKISLKIINFSFEKAKVEISKEIEHLFLSEQQVRDILFEEYEVIFFLTNDNLLLGKDREELFFGWFGKIRPNLYKVCKNAKNLFPCVVWETEKVPLGVQNAYQEFKNINTLLCACSWNKDVFLKQTGIPCVVIPYTLVGSGTTFDASTFQRLTEIKDERFSFCSVSQWGYRKGFDILIKSFLIEFQDDPVDLVLKTYINKAFTFKDETSIIKKEIDDIKAKLFLNQVEPQCRIIVINSLMKKEEINSIYRSSDCYVTCTRGEGFGLPIAEFINFSKPVIVPDKGGHLDFCSRENFFIESRYEPFTEPPHTLYEPRMRIVESSMSSTMEKMREAYNLFKQDNETYLERGKKSREFLSNYLDAKQNTKLFKKLLEK